MAGKNYPQGKRALPGQGKKILLPQFRADNGPGKAVRFDLVDGQRIAQIAERAGPKGKFLGIAEKGDLPGGIQDEMDRPFLQQLKNQGLVSGFIGRPDGGRKPPPDIPVG